jgi:hypothetical protein
MGHVGRCHCNLHADGDAHPHADLHAQRHPHGDRVAYGDIFDQPHAAADGHCHTHAELDSQSASYADGHGIAHALTYGDIHDGAFDAHAHRDGHAAGLRRQAARGAQSLASTDTDADQNPLPYRHDHQAARS